LKCLEKEPHRRYASAAELADDLQRHQAGEPIRARPVSPWMTAWKWAKRRPSLAAMTAAMLLVTTLAFILVARQWQRAAQSAAAEADAKNLALANERKEAAARRQAECATAGMSLNQGANRCESGATQTSNGRRAETWRPGCRISFGSVLNAAIPVWSGQRLLVPTAAA
jgi:hypothetical protein